MILYGISNCDTVKKARKWLDSNGIEYHFHDFRKDGLTKATIEAWVKSIGWQILVNKRSTTWRQLPDEIKNDLDQQQAIEQMLIHPTLIKRPVLQLKTQLLVGFKEQDYQQAIS